MPDGGLPSTDVAPGAEGGNSRVRRARMRRQAASEAELIKLAQEGEKDAFERLVALHEEDVMTLCQRLTRQPADVDDAWQETLKAFWRGLPKFEGRNGAQLSTWLYRVCANAVAGLYRGKTPDPVGTPSELTEATDSGPEAIVEFSEFSEATRWALNQLPDDHRLALVLASQKMKYKEIAKIQYVSEATVKTRVFRARQAMRTLLEIDDV